MSASAAQSVSTGSNGRPEPRFAPHRLWLVFALVATAVTYIGEVRFNFVFDDFVVIVNNPIIRSFKNLGWSFTHHLFATYALTGNYYRPLNIAWFMLEYRMFGLNSGAWHAASLAWHMATTVAVYFLGRKLTGDPWVGVLAALLFGLHPVHIEAVAWVSGPNDLMVSTLMIASFLAFAAARERRSWWRWLVSLALYVVALLIKEPAIVLPGFLALHEWTRPDGKDESRLKTFWRTALAVTPHAIVMIGYLVLRRVVLGASLGQEGAVNGAVLMTIPSVLALYARHLVFPYPLAVVYDTPLVTHAGWSNFILPCIVCAVAVAVLVWASRRSREGFLAVGWFCVCLLPALTIFRVFGDLAGFASDRYLYAPSIGICVLAAIGLRRIRVADVEWLGLPRMQSAVAVVLALALAFGTATQLLPWASDILLFHHAIEIAPQHPLAHTGMGVALHNRGEEGRSVTEFEQAYKLRPDLWVTNFYLGGSYFFLLRDAEAVPYLRRAIEINPNASLSQFLYLGRALTILGRFDEAEEVMLRGKDLAQEMQVSAFFGPEQFDADLQELARRRAAQVIRPTGKP